MSCGDHGLNAASDALMPRKPKHDRSKNCVKCKVARGNIVIRHAVYCKECFFPLIAFKFRRSLEPFVNPKPDGPRRTALKPAGNLLLGFSGGLGSTVLLDLIHHSYVSLDDVPAQGGRDHPRHERVWPQVTVCYIEICDAFPGMKDRTTQIADTIAGYPGVECRTLRVQDAFDRNWWMKVHATPDSSDVGVDLSTGELILSILSNSSTSSSPLGLLHSYLASLPTATAVSSAVQALIRLLLLHTAVETSSSHLVLGTSLTSLAVSLISGVAQGRGFSVREEVQEDWFPEEVPGMPDTGDNLHRGTESPNSGKMKGNGRLSVRVMRPLRDVGMKECAAWAWWKKLRVVGKERWQWSGAKQGIYALTKDFIVGLEKGYPSTVSTVVRTCGKLAPKGRVIGRCVLCERPVQEGWQEWKSSISVQFRLSSNVEIDPIPFLHPSVDCVPPRLSTAPTLTPHLCYACHTTFTSKSSRATPPPLYPSVTKTPLTPLPTWVGSHLLERQEQISTSRMAREEMRSAVSDFLLE